MSEGKRQQRRAPVKVRPLTKWSSNKLAQLTAFTPSCQAHRWWLARGKTEPDLSLADFFPIHL